MATAEQLRRRWFEPGGPALARAVGRWLTSGGPRPDGLDDVDGRVDLRGVSLTGLPTTVGDPDAAGAGPVWEFLDLRGADLSELRLFGAHLTDCVFDRARCTGWRVWGTTVEDCSFVGADLRSRGLGGGGPWHGRPTVWRRVDLRRARLRESHFVGCELHGCTFEAPGPRLVVEGCAVTDVVVRGEVRQLIVTAAGAELPFTGDLSAATFRDSHVVGHALDGVTLPDQDDVRLVRDLPAVLPGLLAQLRAGDAAGAQLAAVWEQWLRRPMPPGTDLLLDLGPDPATLAAFDLALRCC